MGQLNHYEDEYNCIIVVLCGEVREDTADELKYKLKKRYGATGLRLWSAETKSRNCEGKGEISIEEEEGSD